MNDLDEFWVHQVQVEAYTGQASDGSSGYAAAVTVAGFLDEKRTVVRDQHGVEVLASSTLYVPAAAAAPFVPLARVTVHPGGPLERVCQVIAVAPQDSGALGLPDHAVISLT